MENLISSLKNLLYSVAFLFTLVLIGLNVALWRLNRIEKKIDKLQQDPFTRNR